MRSWCNSLLQVGLSSGGDAEENKIFLCCRRLYEGLVKLVNVGFAHAVSICICNTIKVYTLSGSVFVSMSVLFKV